MVKCACGRPATVVVSEYDIAGAKYKTGVNKCDHHFKNDVADGSKPYKVTRLALFREELIVHTKGNSGRC